MTKRKMYKEMRKILRYVERGGNPHITTVQESDLWGECFMRGFLNASSDSGQDESGMWHIILLNHNITPAGIEWLYAPNTDRKSTIALIVSLGALLVSVFANLDKIASNLIALSKFLGF